MNAVSLYMSTCRVMLTATPADTSSWVDLFRLLPYLRHSLCCVVCVKLVVQPFSPQSSICQHNVCKLCLGGEKKLEPPCPYCEDYNDYTEHISLGYLIRCYKKMCSYFMSTDMYKLLISGDELDVEGGLVSIFGLLRFVQEAAKYNDDYLDYVALPDNPYDMLPYVCDAGEEMEPEEELHAEELLVEEPEIANVREVASPTPTVSSVYSVTYSGLGNKITIKRTAPSEPVDSPTSDDRSSPIKEHKKSKSAYKRPSRYRSSSKRKGCRCGNATATPGKLTCCGQRCPCYVKGKACAECKCKGCRNTHLADGRKLHSVLQSDALAMNSESNSDSADSLDTVESDNSQASEDNTPLNEKGTKVLSELSPYAEDNSCSPKYFQSPLSSQTIQSPTPDHSDNSNHASESPHSEDETKVKVEVFEVEENNEDAD